MDQTVVGLFSDANEAQSVVTELMSSGFKRDQITVTSNDTAGTQSTAPKTNQGGLMGLFNQLLGEGVPETDAGYYAEGVRRRGTLVTVKATDQTAQRASDVMTRHNGMDIELQGAALKKTGYTGFNEKIAAEPYTGEHILPVIQEELKVGKRAVEGGGMRVYTRVSQTPVEEKVTLHQEKVTVERHPVNRPITDADTTAFKEQSIEMTETSEEAVVSKTARVVEEVVIGKTSTDRTETVRDTVRRTDVEVEKIAGETKTVDAGYERYGTDFRKYYDTNYAKSGMTYDQYVPVYQYGYNLGTDKQFSSGDWNTLEKDIRTRWEKSNPNTWEKFKDAIKYAWDKARSN